MRREAKSLIGRHDFSAFKSSCGRDDKGINCVRTVKRLRISEKNGLIDIEIEADGFLYNMVRNIVGTLIEVGRGRFPSGCARGILKSRDRRAAGPTAPSKGLCLLRVHYINK